MKFGSPLHPLCHLYFVTTAPYFVPFKPLPMTVRSSASECPTRNYEPLSPGTCIVISHCLYETSLFSSVSLSIVSHPSSLGLSHYFFFFVYPVPFPVSFDPEALSQPVEIGQASWTEIRGKTRGFRGHPLNYCGIIWGSSAKIIIAAREEGSSRLMSEMLRLSRRSIDGPCCFEERITRLFFPTVINARFSL